MWCAFQLARSDVDKFRNRFSHYPTGDPWATAEPQSDDPKRESMDEQERPLAERAAECHNLGTFYAAQSHRTGRPQQDPNNAGPPGTRNPLPTWGDWYQSGCPPNGNTRGMLWARVHPQDQLQHPLFHIAQLDCLPSSLGPEIEKISRTLEKRRHHNPRYECGKDAFN